MKLCAPLLLALVPALALAAIPPQNFELPSADAQLGVAYQSNGSALPVQPGILFGIDVPEQAPTVTFDAGAGTGPFLLLMVDPDASYPQNPTNRFIIHWWQDGLSSSGGSLTNSTPARVDYRRPRPPYNSSAHRYIQYLFSHDASWQVPAQFQGYGNGNSSRFPLESFLSAAQGLQGPIAANYFYCSNETIVPAQFVGQPGSEYPGGNGAMITMGSNAPSSTSMSSSTSTTPSGPPATYTGAGHKPRADFCMLLVAVGMVATAKLI